MGVMKVLWMARLTSRHTVRRALGVVTSWAYLSQVRFVVVGNELRNARAASTMRSACWLNNSKKLPSRGKSLPKAWELPGGTGNFEENVTRW